MHPSAGGQSSAGCVDELGADRPGVPDVSTVARAGRVAYEHKRRCAGVESRAGMGCHRFHGDPRRLLDIVDSDSGEGWRYLTSGQSVKFEWQRADQEGFGFRATRVWDVGVGTASGAAVTRPGAAASQAWDIGADGTVTEVEDGR